MAQGHSLTKATIASTLPVSKRRRYFLIIPRIAVLPCHSNSCPLLPNMISKRKLKEIEKWARENPQAVVEKPDPRRGKDIELTGKILIH